ncbi:protein PET100 homolog, mitochondrial [Thalassophryne amazonica]|uniref:protein PET100 homolog, mitochondrial n=1 Tax=Thalassophryne amazonica TaxID=390379 RepID=UPI0014720B17|nr:protein PET100 homolog, mitochondrial [Thalassophryne amazonica]
MGVKLEIFRMVLYLSFPVGMFWVANQPQFFEEYVNKTKRELFPPDMELRRKEMEEFHEQLRIRREKRRLKKMGVDSES